VEGPLEEAHRREMLAFIASSLDDEGREILFKRYFENRSLKEIGDDLGLSQSRVSKILGRLVDRLKDRFEHKVN
jgi:RNA polymerase sigma factor (sigma-70 family)